MTRKELEQVYFLRNEVKMWQQKLDEYNADIALSPKTLDGMPYSKTNNVSSPTEEKAIRLANVNKIIDGKKTEIQLIIADIEEFITSIDDSVIRQIVNYRCCKLLSWKQIARKIGEGYTEEAVRQTYHRYVRHLPKE